MAAPPAESCAISSADLVQRSAGGSLPVGTLVVNITGSFLLGLLYRYAVDMPGISAEVRARRTIGLCGGYTTFSSFSYESVRRMEDGQLGRALAGEGAGDLVPS